MHKVLMELRKDEIDKNYRGTNKFFPLDVFEFNEEDELRSHFQRKVIQKKIFHNAFRQRRSVITGKKVKSGMQSKSRLHHKAKSHEVILDKSPDGSTMEAGILYKSPENDPIETDSSDSDSHRETWRKSKAKPNAFFCKSNGSTLTCNFIQVNNNEEFIKEEKVVTVNGKIQLFLGGNGVGVARLIFTVNAIAMKMRYADPEHSITWKLQEIESLECALYGEGKPGGIIELRLGKAGAQALGRKMNELQIENDDSFNIFSNLTIQTDESLEEKVRQITSLSNEYRLRWKPGNQYPLDDWSDILFPVEDNDAITVTKHDYLLLNPEEFISDTIIDFYIKYLQRDLPMQDKNRFYFFNSFFFRKLEKIEKNHQHGFDRLKRWTAGVNISEKHYIFIPIMQSSHWSLAIICNKGRLLTVGHDMVDDTKSLFVLHFDSLEGSHWDIENPIRSYLSEAWNWNGKYADISKRLSSIDFQAAKVPQQTNYSDCGLFLLHYVELFIKEVQKGDSLDFVTHDWFDPVDASLKRNKIKMILKDLQKNQSGSPHTE